MVYPRMCIHSFNKVLIFHSLIIQLLIIGIIFNDSINMKLRTLNDLTYIR
jgi:hypothetical protein